MSRDFLAVSKLSAFSDYLVANGWTIEQPKGEYEVLRARMPGVSKPLLVYSKLSTIAGNPTVHLSLFGISETWAKKFIYSLKQPK